MLTIPRNNRFRGESLTGLSLSEALAKGVRFPLVNNYGIDLGRAGLEAGAGAAAAGTAAYLLNGSSGGTTTPLGKKSR